MLSVEDINSITADGIIGTICQGNFILTATWIKSSGFHWFKADSNIQEKEHLHKSSIKLVLSKITDLGIGHTLLPLNLNYFNEHASL